LIRRVQFPDADGFSVDEDFAEGSVSVAAYIETAGPMMWLGSISADNINAITHRMYMRWMPLLDKTQLIQRELDLPDGTHRTENFTVVRVEEDQAFVWVCIDCTLTNVTYA